MRLGQHSLLLCLVLASCGRGDPSASVDPAPQAPERRVSPTRSISLLVSPFRSQLREVFRPVAEAVGVRLGVQVELKVAASYEDAIEKLAKGEVDLCFLPPLSYVRARRRAPGLALVCAEEIRAGLTDRAILVCRDEKEIQNTAALAERRFGLVSKASASGFVFPSVYLARQGLDPKHVLREGKVVWARDHDRVLELLFAGKVDVAATYDWAVTKSSGRLREGLRVLAWSEPFPHSVVAARQGFPRAWLPAIKDAFLALSRGDQEDKRVRQALDKLNMTGFVRLKEAALAPLRRLDKEFRR